MLNNHSSACSDDPFIVNREQNLAESQDVAQNRISDKNPDEEDRVTKCQTAIFNCNDSGIIFFFFNQEMHVKIQDWEIFSELTTLPQIPLAPNPQPPQMPFEQKLAGRGQFDTLDD